MSGAVSRDEIERLIFEVLRDELLEVGDDFTPKSDLVNAGLNSLAVVQLLLSIEERAGVWIDEAELTPENLASVEALARCVDEKRG